VRFEFLGTGTSAGIPALGCTCAVCTSIDPRDNRLRTAAALRFTDPDGNPRNILLDCGPDFRQQALRSRLARLDAILFTHNHVDHTFGLDEVRRYNAVQNAPIDIYAEPPTLDFLRSVYQHIFDPSRNVNDSFVASLIPHPLTPERPLTIHGLHITPLRVHHGRLPILGFRFDRASGLDGGTGLQPVPIDLTAAAPHSPLPLAYLTDVSSIPPETYPHLRNLRTLVLDALRHRHHPTHLTLDQAIDIAHRIAAQQTYFVHMSHDLPHEETQATLTPTIHLAHDGLVLE